MPIEKARHQLDSNGIKFVGSRLLEKYLPVAEPPPDGDEESRKKARALMTPLAGVSSLRWSRGAGGLSRG